MLQVDLPLAYAVGTGLALAAKNHLKDEPSLWHNRFLTPVLSYFGFVHVPASLFFLTLWTDWDVMYLWSRDTLPFWVSPLFALGTFAFGMLGFVAAHSMIRRNRLPLAAGLAVLCVLFTVAVCIRWHDRFLYVGTQAGYRFAPAVNIFQSDLIWGFVVLIGVVMGIPQGVLMLRFWRTQPQATSDKRQAGSW